MASGRPMIDEGFRNSRRRYVGMLTEFLQLKERYALLHPMLFDSRIEFQHQALMKRRGFDTLQRSLFLSCCLDIYKLTLDQSSQASMTRCIHDLKNPKLIPLIRAQYIKDELKTCTGSDDPIVAPIEQALVPERTIKFGKDFDKRRVEVIAAWKQILHGGTFALCKTVRHDLVAHTHLGRAAFEPIDIQKLGIDFSELKPAIDLMQGLIEQLGGLIHGTGFAWDQLERTVTGAADDFWGVSGLSLNQIVMQGGIRRA